MINGLIIAIVCVSVALVITWLTVGVKWLFIINDFKSKKDYLREISEELSKLNHKLANIDKAIYMRSSKDE